MKFFLAAAICVAVLFVRPHVLQAQQARLVLPIGHSGSVISAAFSPDNRQVVTASSDGTVRVWDVQSGQLLTTLRPPNNDLREARFSSNGRRIISYGWMPTSYSWDAQTDRLLWTDSIPMRRTTVSPSLLNHLTGNTDTALSGTPGPDGTRLVTLYAPINSAQALMPFFDNKAKLWAIDKGRGRLVAELQWQHDKITQVSFSADGKMIALNSDDGASSVWAARTGQLMYMLRDRSAIQATAFSPDGTMIVTASTDGTATIRDAKTGAALIRLAGHAIQATHVAFSPDGGRLVVRGDDDRTRVFDLGTGKLLFGETGAFLPLATSFSPDGQRFLYSRGDTLAVVDAMTGKPDKILPVPGFLQDARWSADGKKLMCASGKGLVLWDPGRDVVQLLPLYDRSYVREVFAPNGSQVLTMTHQTTRLWALPTGRLLQEFPPVFDLSPEIQDDRLLGDLAYTQDGRARFSPDGKKLLLLYVDSSLLWDIDSTRGVMLPNKGDSAFYSAAFTADGKYIIGRSSYEGDIFIDQTATGLSFRSIPENLYLAGPVAASPDSKELALALHSGEVQLIDISTGRVSRSLGGVADIMQLAYSPDGQTLVTLATDRTIRIWDVGEARLRYSLVALDNTDWLAIDPQGRYDGTEEGKKMLYYTCGREIVDLEQLKSLSWEPDLVAKIMGINKEPITARPTDSMNICGYTPLVEEKGLYKGNYQWDITARAGGIGEIQLFVNNKLIKTYAPGALPLEAAARRLVVPAAAVEPWFTADGRNRVLVRATTHDGAMSSRGIPIAARTTMRVQPNPDMYILSIGVSKYKDAALALHYAAKDATDFSHATAMAARRLLNTDDGRDHVHVWTCGTDPGDRLWPDRRQINALFDSIAARAQANDILILFFAGHGVLRKGERNYYLLTQEAASFDQINSIPRQVAISTDEIETWMRTVKANKQLLILDACGSGQAINNLHGLVAKREIPANQQRALEKLKDQTGTFILSASAADESAYEISLYSQGLLTYSLLTGMKLGSGLRDQQYVDVSKWFNAAADEVKLLAHDIGGRQDPQLIGTASFDIGIVDQSIADSIQLARPKKVFVRSMLIGDEATLGDSMRLSAQVDQQLNELAATTRGGLSYLPDNNGSDSTYSIRGRYTLVNGEVKLNVSLYRGQKEKSQTLEEAVPLTDAVKLAQYIVQHFTPYTDKP